MNTEDVQVTPSHPSGPDISPDRPPRHPTIQKLGVSYLEFQSIFVGDYRVTTERGLPVRIVYSPHHLGLLTGHQSSMTGLKFFRNLFRLYLFILRLNIWAVQVKIKDCSCQNDNSSCKWRVWGLDVIHILRRELVNIVVLGIDVERIENPSILWCHHLVKWGSMD